MRQKRKSKEPSKETVARLRKLVVDYVLAHGGRWYRQGDEATGLILPTVIGILHVAPIRDWIACRWEDVERAREYFGVTRLSEHRLNPYSGKWNFGCGARLLPEQVFEEWRQEVEPLLCR